ncbi:MAG: hypothetical protein GYB68_08500 [Chloroflexi bacterium]|nr:hypothetical protein [Chloroflexota bacterium]
MDDLKKKLADLFMETGHAHHQAYIETDGADPEWALWYADYLIDKLPAKLEIEMTKSELIYVLWKLSLEQPLQGPETPWPEYYAQDLIERYKG